MPDTLPALATSVLAILAGAAIGAVFYGGLWWTVRHAATFRRPGLALLGSFVARTGVAAGGFYLVGAGDWIRLLLCLLGFVSARLAVTWLTRLPASARAPAAPEARHAP
ncbi:MAG: ATP synthase subunit I [Pseudomonadota bacterium]|nr:ATP synthase subunit I [Pseudomonadota bacterium]